MESGCDNWIKTSDQKPIGDKKVLTWTPDLEGQYRLLNPICFKTFPIDVEYWCELISPIINIQKNSEEVCKCNYKEVWKSVRESNKYIPFNWCPTCGKKLLQ